MKLYFSNPTNPDEIIARREAAHGAVSPEEAAKKLAELDKAIGRLTLSTTEITPPTDDEPSEGANDQLTNEE